MKNRSEAGDALDALKEKLAGLGEGSIRKTYYPELQQRIEELRQSEEFLKNIVENIPAMVFVKDAAELRYVALNKAGEEVLGYSREELLGKSDRDIFPEEQAAFFSQKDREVLSKGDLLEVPEEVVKTRHGDRILRTKKIPLYDGNGKAQYMLGIAEDITDRKHLEEQLLQSQKMEAIGQLAGGVAHDFNNILMVIMGYGNMLKMDITLDVRQKEKILQIIDASEKAAHLTRSLLEFSRKHVMKPRLALVNDIVRNVQKFLVRIIGEDVQLQSVLDQADHLVNVDTGQIEQVLINLATNARDAMPKGGVLTIETGLRVVDTSFVQARGCGEPGSYALITVSDTGTGMDEKTRERIFEPFFTTKAPGKGTGLGMPIVYGIIRQHNGFIDLQSEPGMGTTFSIYIPIASRPPVSPEEAGAAEPPPRGGAETILLGEDDEAVRDLLENILRGGGYQVILAGDGQEAVQKFAANRDRVALVLMDVIMPKMSGKEACDEIRRLRADVRVLYASGYAMDAIQKRDLLEEGVELIMKPVPPDELLKKVREMLDR